MHAQHTALATRRPRHGLDDADTATWELQAISDTVVLFGAPGADTAPIPLPFDPRILVDLERGLHPRWRPGERLEHVFEQQTARLRMAGSAGRLCVDAPGAALTYEEVDARANRLARHLLAHGIGSGHRVALLFDDPVQAYVAMLGVLKAGAAFVPLDAGFPADRMAYIVADAEVSVVLSLAHLHGHLAAVRAQVVALDDLAAWIDRERGAPVTDAERGPLVDDLAYIIYTSGSTGRPKGVAVEHPSIVNFVRVAAELYGYRGDDRVYQGLTMAFDFSVEEIWVPWAVGATLVPKPPGGSLLGADLHGFLTERRVTAMCCVPTLLATVEEELPALRFLLVSGEACPHDLIVRWHRPGRRFLNVYGPTETTVTATWTVVDPDRPVTIGAPLPTYSVVVLDPQNPARALPRGAVGEIGIGGVGLAAGYLNRADLTAAAFIPDFLGLPANPSRRIYRTGDLGRVTAEGEIEYLGRIDLQVKIRGYRIELTEIESVMLQVPGVAQAVVDTYEPLPGVTELVGYYTARSDYAGHGEGAFAEDRLLAHLRDRLPSYMVPAYLERLAAIPMTTSDKADRKNLPAPTGRRSGPTTEEHVAPETVTERLLADLLAQSLGVERVSATAHFFDDLGANSLLMARFARRVRDETSLGPVGMRDIYLHPTVRALALLADAAPAAMPVVPTEVTRVGTLRYLLCGLAQLLILVGVAGTVTVLESAGVVWVQAGPTFLDLWMRAIGLTAATFGGFLVFSVAAKWLLVGRWRATEFPLWGWRYLRFWMVRQILRINPLVVLAGSPLYNLYLRALGARIGAGAVVLSRSAPVCADLVTVGARAVVRRNTSFTGYRAVGGRIQTGPVTIGADAVVGEFSIMDIGSSLGDGAQLGHASSLQTGQAVPDGQSWHGSPAVPCDVDYRRVGPARCGRVRRTAYALWQLVNLVALTIPLALAVSLLLLRQVPAGLNTLSTPADPGFYVRALTDVTAVLAVAVTAWLAVVTTIPRLLHLGLRTDVVYPLYGVRYGLFRAVSRLTTSRFFVSLFGDSSAIPHYLRCLGYRFGPPLVQSGTNFGMEVGHDNPYLTVVGSGTMVSDAVTFLSAEISDTSFRLRPSVLGADSFLGNSIAIPPDARIGDNCLLATKVMVPIDGPVRRGVGLLGSPAFTIPRTVERDHAFDTITGEERRRRLHRKNRHNAATALLFLLTRLGELYGVTLIGLLAFDNFVNAGWAVAALAPVAVVAFSMTYHVLLERASWAFRAMSPRFCSIYDRRFWRHERFWKLSGGGPYMAAFNGTPMKGLIWRALGVRVGHKVFDDGCNIVEKTLVTVGDHACLNAGSIVQAHSLEDGAFKSDQIVVGQGATLGPQSFVHYGVTLGEGAVLDADAFLMKGQAAPAFTRWRGNPAAETWEPLASLPAPGPSSGLTATLTLAALAAVALPAVFAVAVVPDPVTHPVPAPSAISSAANPPAHGPAGTTRKSPTKRAARSDEVVVARPRVAPTRAPTHTTSPVTAGVVTPTTSTSRQATGSNRSTPTSPTNRT